MPETPSAKLHPGQPNPWLLAARPRTLPAAAAPVLVAAALAWHNHTFSWLYTLLCLLISLTLQIAANFANDLFDFERGADGVDRLGPTRATAAGLITPRQMRLAVAISLGIAALLGLFILFQRGWIVLALGLFLLLSALAYSGGPLPYGYYGLGDLFVLLTFGLAAVAGSYFAISGHLSPAALLFSLPPGLLIVNILVVNNTRDIETDRSSGKYTLAVRLGRAGMQTEYLACLLGAYLLSLLGWSLGFAGPGVWLTLLACPLALVLYREFSRAEGRALNQTLARTAQFAFVFSALLAVGILL